MLYDLTVAEICEKLQDTGYEKHGNEILYNGMTGNKRKQTYLGPTFTKIETHGNDKARTSNWSNGSYTRQPSEGRARMVDCVLEKWNVIV